MYSANAAKRMHLEEWKNKLTAHKPTMSKTEETTQHAELISSARAMMNNSVKNYDP